EAGAQGAPRQAARTRRCQGQGPCEAGPDQSQVASQKAPLMHPNSAFRPQQDDLAALLVREIGFAAIFAGTPDGPRLAHAPVILSEDAKTLQFHLARGNGLTKHLAGAAALVVVQGPDAYDSATWYADQTHAVPTWNYVAVEMEGVPRQLDDAGLVAQLDALAALHEARAGEDP